jgi:hypothetical protein
MLRRHSVCLVLQVQSAGVKMWGMGCIMSTVAVPKSVPDGHLVAVAGWQAPSVNLTQSVESNMVPMF